MDPAGKPSAQHYLRQTDEQLLTDCEVHIYKSSGPGGQHRNKVSSAVRVHHRPTGITAHGDDSRSQHENKHLALKRLRMNIALRLRGPLDPKTLDPDHLPPEAAACVQPNRAPGGQSQPPLRLDVSARSDRFWPLAAFLLDLLDASQARIADAAVRIGVSTSNLIGQLKRDHHLWGAAQDLRKAHGQGPLK